MSWLIGLVLLLVAVGGLMVVITRDPRKQVFVLGANGLILTLFFFVLQAPDVAISEVGVGAAIVPLLFLVALTAINNDRERRGK